MSLPDYLWEDVVWSIRCHKLGYIETFGWEFKWTRIPLGFETGFTLILVIRQCCSLFQKLMDEQPQYKSGEWWPSHCPLVWEILQRMCKADDLESYDWLAKLTNPRHLLIVPPHLTTKHGPHWMKWIIEHQSEQKRYETTINDYFNWAMRNGNVELMQWIYEQDYSVHPKKWVLESFKFTSTVRQWLTAHSLLPKEVVDG